MKNTNERKSLMESTTLGCLSLIAAVASQTALASETLLYLDYDNDTRSVKQGVDLIPYVYDGNYNLVRDVQNAGFLRIPNGTPIWTELDATSAAAIKTAGEDLTIEFFIKGNPDSLRAWEYLLTIGGPWDWSIRIDADASRNLRVSTSPGGEHPSSISLVDGKWHHVAVTVTPIAGGSHIEAFADYNLLYSTDATSVFKYSQGGVLSINQNSVGGCGGCDVDEIRYSRGVLSQSEFLRLDDTPPPVDGSTLLYLPLDADAKTIAYTNKQGTVSGFTDLTSATRTHTAVKEWGTGTTIRSENKAFLQQATDHDLYVYDSFYALESEHCQTCTIEFFIKGGPAVASWETPLCYGYWSSVGTYGLLLQIDDSKKIWMKPGVGSLDVGFQVPIDLSKEKWHHVAVTVQPSTKAGCEGGSYFEVFTDYAETPVVTANYAEPFNGLRWGRMIFNINKDSHCALDELRVTKGVLPVSKFLSFEKLGFIMSFK